MRRVLMAVAVIAGVLGLLGGGQMAAVIAAPDALPAAQADWGCDRDYWRDDCRGRYAGHNDWQNWQPVAAQWRFPDYGSDPWRPPWGEIAYDTGTSVGVVWVRGHRPGWHLYAFEDYDVVFVGWRR